MAGRGTRALVRVHLAASSASLAMLVISATAHAQEVRGPERPAEAPQSLSPATSATVVAPGSPGATGLEDIVVTARKVAENQQRVPVAVTVQSGATLQRQNAVRIPDIARLTPGITFQAATSTATASAIAIRGQVQTDVLATLDPSVGTYVDGFYWARAYGLNADLLDVQSAQVLRGPQGTLFGRNTTGGALLLQTNDPNYRGVSALVSGTYGRFNERVGTAVLNLPIIDDRIAIRGAFSINKRDGFYHDTESGADLGARNSYTGRVKLLMNPTDNFSLLLSAELFRTSALTRPYYLLYVSPTSPTNTEAALENFGVGSTAAQGAAFINSYMANSNGTNNVALDEDPRSYAKTQTYTATANLNTFFGAVKFIGGYRKVDAYANIDLDGSPVNVVRTLGQQDLDSYSGELQITGKALDRRVDFATGAFAFHEAGSDQSTSISLPALSRASAGGTLGRTIYFGNVNTDSIGIYGQATYHFNDKLSVVGGVRYSVEDKGIASYNRNVDADTGTLVRCLIAGADPQTCRIARKDAFSGVSYTAGINYQLTPDALLYVKTSKGFRSGGQNLRASGTAGAAFQPFGPEIAREEEVGFKGEFFDRRVRFNLAAFYNEVSDIQRTTLVTTVIGGVTQTATIVSNAGKARFYGGEAELTAKVADGLTIGATGALVNAKYLKYADASGDRRDEAFANVPQWTFSVAGDYVRDVGFGNVVLHADYAWQGRTALYNFRTLMTGNAAADAITTAIAKALTRPAGGELNARLGVTVLDKKLDVALFGRNILNRRYYNTGLLFGAPLNVASGQRNDPVTYGVTATYHFGE